MPDGHYWHFSSENHLKNAYKYGKSEAESASSRDSV